MNSSEKYYPLFPVKIINDLIRSFDDKVNWLYESQISRLILLSQRIIVILQLIWV